MPRPPASSLLSFLAIALVGLNSSGVRAQITSNATCLSNWRDLYNSRGQSPCLVGAYAGGACNGGQYDVGALLEGEHYIGPTSSSAANGCLCSTVMYSLMGACSTCQNATIITYSARPNSNAWSAWSANCPEVFVQSFPQDIPQDTAVPGWAYDPIPNNGTFDVNQALADTSPESTATFVQSTNTGTRTTTGTASSVAQADGGDDDDGGGSNTGAIAGGVVGGVVGVALLGLLGFFLYRRKRNQNLANAKLNSIQNSGVNANLTGSTYAGGAPGGPQGMGEYAPVPYTPHAYEGGGGAGGMASPPIMGQKLYDPNDPSTFPTAASLPPVSMTNQTTGSGANLSYAPSFPQPQTSNQGAYRGVAEV